MSRVRQGYADGGLFANGPSVLTLLLQQIRHEHETSFHSRDFLREISLFSLSESPRMHYLEAGPEDWRYNHWLFHPSLPFALIELALISDGQEISEQCRLLLGDNQYFRLNPLIEPPVSRATHVRSPTQILETLGDRPRCGSAPA